MGRDAHLPAFPGLEAPIGVQVKDCWEEQAPLKEVD
jgi:hypothetical protein